VNTPGLLACLLWTALRIAAQPPDPAALLSKALALARQGQVEPARELLERGRHAYPADKRFLEELAGLAYRRKDLFSTASYLRAALRLDPADPYAHSFLAAVNLMQGNLEAALVHWNRLDQPVLAEVTLVPAPPLKPLLQERSVAVSAGQILTFDRLRITQANLDRLAVFPSYRFELTPSGPDRFSLNLRLTDGDIWRGWPARLLLLARALPYRTLMLDRTDIGQRAINLSTLWRWDPNRYRAMFALTGPWRQDPRYIYRFLLDARDERWDLTRSYRGPGGPLSDVHLRRIEAGADLVIGLNGRLQWTPGVRLVRALYDRGHDSSLFSSYWSITARNQLEYELWNAPERRIRIDSAGVLETGSILRRETTRFASITGDLLASWLPFARDRDTTFRTRIRSGRAFGALPLDSLFQLGMDRDNDLWLRGHLAAHDSRKGNAPLGSEYALWQMDVERAWLRLPLVKVAAGPFFDSGWVGDHSGRLGSQGWLHDTGVQMNVTAAGKVRWTLVYGRDLRDGRGVFYTGVERVTPRSPRR